MGKKKKIIKIKLISRLVVILIVMTILVILIKILISGKKEEEIELTLIVDNQNITDSLNQDIYINKDQKLYMSIEDIKNIFDKNIFFEEETGKLITTSDTKVGAIDVNNNTLELNSAIRTLPSGIIKYDSGYYIPISDITNIYNIEIISNNNTAIVSSLYKEQITVRTAKVTALKEKKSIFSSTIQKLEKGQELILLEQGSTAVGKPEWLQVFTNDGKIGFIKEKDVIERKYKRTNMKESDFSTNTIDENNSLELTNKEINIENLQNFSVREKTIENIISDVISTEKYTVKINLENVEIESELLKRFIIEIKPRLKEIGGNIMITNNNILDNTFISENNLIGG